MEARQIPGTTKIICTMTGHNGPTRGAIGVVDRSRGVNAQAGHREHHARHAGAGGRQGQRQHGRQQAVQRPHAAGRETLPGFGSRSDPGPRFGGHVCVAGLGPAQRRPAVFLCNSRAASDAAARDPQPAAGQSRRRQSRSRRCICRTCMRAWSRTIQRGEVQVDPRGPRTAEDRPHRSQLARVRLPVPGDLLRGDLRGQGRDRRSGREPGRLGLFPSAVRRAAVLHGVGQGRPSGAADAQLYALDARRSPGLRRLPRIAARFAVAAPGRLGHGTEEAAAAGVGQRRV